MNYVYICYKVEDDKDKVIAVCTSEEECDKYLGLYDCYRKVPVNTELKEPAWEDLHYKVEDGYTTVE